MLSVSSSLLLPLESSQSIISATSVTLKLINIHQSSAKGLKAKDAR